MTTTLYAETLPYWETGKSSADTWIERAKKEIASVGGRVTGEAFGADANGSAAFILGFSIADEHYRLTWPVIASKTGKDKSARIQAATALYHDVKARVVSAKFLGIRGAFLTFLVLDNGKTANELTSAELAKGLPLMLTAGGIE